MKPTAAEIEAGQAVYTDNTLRIYDIVVLGISNRFIWKCPTPRLLGLYNSHVSANHLDVGVGTGYYLDHCTFPGASPRVALMDMNTSTLDFAAQRIKRYAPETHQQNLFEPITADIAPFDSVAANYLFHCMPGGFEDKAVAIDHLLGLMKPGARFFGSTILSGGVPRSWTARKLMDAYNAKGIFSNAMDTLDGLGDALRQRFDQVEISVIGCVAVFNARKA